MLNIKTQTKQIGIPLSAVADKTVKDVLEEVKEDLGLEPNALLYRKGSQLRNKDTIAALKVMEDETLTTFQGASTQSNQNDPSTDHILHPAVHGGSMGVPRVDLVSPIKAQISSMQEKIEDLQQRSLNNSNRGHTTDADWYYNNGTRVVSPWFNPHDIKTIFNKKWICKETDTERDDVQPRWTDDVIPAINKLGLKVKLVDSFNTKSVGSRRPDITGYLADKPINEFYIAIVGDIKGGRNKDTFTAQEKGKIGGFLNRVIVETKRALACGFLTDGRIIQFFRLRNGSMEETKVYFLKGEGEGLLLGMLNCDYALLGVEIGAIYVQTNEVTILSHLGIGAQSIVWKGEYLKKEVVVKKFTNTHELLEHEAETLKAIASVPNVTKLEAEITSDPMAILLSPVGVHFVGTFAIGDTNTVFRMSHFECLVCTLREVHQLGFVHRDIKPSNFFQYKTEPNKLFINDWSSSQRINSPTPFGGTRLYATEEYLCNVVNPYPPQPWHDLEAAVKSLYVVMHSAIFFSQFCNETQCKDRARIVAFWKTALKPQHWHKLLQAARASDYSAMLIQAATFAQTDPYVY